MLALGYVDVRGIWPVYVYGLKAITLKGKPRSITAEDAHQTAQKLGLL